MVLKTRHFRLLDASSVPREASLDDIVREVSPEECSAAGRHHAPAAAFACAHELAFDPKGTPNCNLSM